MSTIKVKVPEYLIIYKGKIVETRKSQDPHRLEAIMQEKYLGCRLEPKPIGISRLFKFLLRKSY